MFSDGFTKIAKSVFVYRNIRKSKNSYTYSVRGPKGVEMHTDNVGLLNPKLKVSKKGLERVRREGVKNVHAGIQGTIGNIDPNQFNWREMTYDPKKHESFIYRDDESEVSNPDAVILTPKGAVAGFRR